MGLRGCVEEQVRIRKAGNQHLNFKMFNMFNMCESRKMLLRVLHIHRIFVRSVRM